VQKSVLMKYSCLIFKTTERTSIEVVTREWSSSKFQYNLIPVQNKFYIRCLYLLSQRTQRLEHYTVNCYLLHVSAVCT
jgi:hypothetical protein